MSLLQPLLLLAASITAASADMASSIQQHQQHRILHNAETGTITHPLVPHKEHLARRRRELRELHDKDGKNNNELDLTLPPRPHTSRHSSNAKDVIEKSIGSGTNLRGRQLQQQMGALYQGYGTHYVDLWVGSPIPQRQTVIVDTGSGVTAFPCEECTGCGDQYHTDGYFAHSQSTTFRELTCDECFRGYCSSMSGGKKCKISMSYAEGSSWTAYESMDLCYAGGPHDQALQVNGAMVATGPNVDHIDPVEAPQFAFELAFGCQISITGLFITQLADGIMGMENDKTAFWKQMHSKNAIPNEEFSLCFSRQDYTSKDGTRAGAMTLGGVDPRLHNVSPMVFAKNTHMSGFFGVHLRAVYLREGGGLSAQTTLDDMSSRMHRLEVSEQQLNSGKVIVDSGTTDTYMTSRIASAFKTTWKQITGKDYSHSGMKLTPEELESLPTIIIVIQGYDGSDVGDEPFGEPNDVPGWAGDALSPSFPKDVVLSIPASHYMEYDPEKEVHVARFYTEEGSGSVIGANAMMGHDVYFDIPRGRVGFAESDCDYATLLETEGTSISVAPQTNTDQSGSSSYSDLADQAKGKAAEIIDDMKHECSSTECRGVAGFLIFSALVIVIAAIRRATSRRRMLRQYQEAELEISDLALNSDSDSDDGSMNSGYTDEPPMPPQLT
eukprot:CAMPEP_0113378104 /NCGR_PEP_ID=MMETSP0013_2-20120614/3515_1 /TAXON_ID=2843 ORGANISM="Skeletonema costatum, Strain 1716" /NCGR_SAMPLE_ID=MMETSP0013_2 /ASSEMBLY_ACC=CAM_ASM_000158 /LENGTH=666 /DNA_ID=CAMNT_0000260291 /DNA_START=10 /DNA_END=2010 /DNA_ORIENTATION=+ /assembly_acc=CAM_ASM_000158